MGTSPMKGSGSKGCKKIGTTIEDMTLLKGQVVGKINFSLRNKIQLFNKYIFTKNILNIKKIAFIQLLKWFKF